MEKTVINQAMELHFELSKLHRLIDYYRIHKGETPDPDIVSIKISIICERALMILIEDNGIEQQERFSSPYRVALKAYPFAPEMKEYLNRIRQTRNELVHGMSKIDYFNIFEYLEAFDYFMLWFYYNCKTMRQLYETGVFSQPYRSMYEHVQSMLDEIESGKTVQPNYGELIGQILNKIDNQSQAISDIQSCSHQIYSKVENIEQQLHDLSAQLSLCQSMIQNQLSRFEDDSETTERLLQSFSDICIDRISSEIGNAYSENSYRIEEEKLKLLMGSSWNKMTDDSKKYLVTARLTFQNYLSLRDIADYSGICLLVTKALEVELSERFAKGFLHYLKQRFPNRADYPRYHTCMLKHNKPIRVKDFTLGSTAFILGLKFDSSITEAQKAQNHTLLFDYVRTELLSPELSLLSDDQLEQLILDFAENIDTIKDNYRNKAAHTNALRQVDAKECFDYVLDVEQILKKILEAFK